MSSASPAVDLTGLQTELRNTNSADIDKVSTLELCRIINRQDFTVPAAARAVPRDYQPRD